MPLNPQEQERANRLNQQFPRGGIPIDIEADLRNNLIDRQAEEIISAARNRAAYYNDRLMVPSDAELQYRATSPNPLAEGLAKQPRPNPTPPTTPPLNIPTVRTSSAAPPPTPRTSGLGVGNGMQAAPTTAAPRVPLGNNPSPGALPTGLPGPAGSLLYPGIGAGITFGSRLIAGQPLGQAAFGAAGAFGGTVAGSIVGSAFGPIGTFVGGTVGGFLGGLAADLIYNAAFPSTAIAPIGLSDPKTGVKVFEGGQCLTRYTVESSIIANNTTEPFSCDVFGPIGGARVVIRSEGANYYRATYQIYCQGPYTNFYRSPQPENWYTVGQNPGMPPDTIYKINSVRRNDSLPDNCGSPSPEPIPTDNRLAESIAHPGNNDYAPKTAVPQVTNITNNYTSNPPVNNYAPGGLSSKSNGDPKGNSPDWVTKGNLAGDLHANYSPLPIASLPSLEFPSDPTSTGAPTNTASGVPGKSPFVFKPDGSYEIITPGGPLTTGNPQINPSDVSYPPTGFQPLILQPNPLVANPISSRNFTSSPNPNTATPSGMPRSTRNRVTPDATKETPTAPPTTSAPDLTEQFQKEIEKLKKQQEDQLIPVMILLTGITAVKCQGFCVSRQIIVG